MSALNSRTNTEGTLFTTGRIAKLMGVAPRTVAKWFDRGELVGYRLPGSTDRRVTLEQFQVFLIGKPELRKRIEQEFAREKAELAAAPP